MPARYLLTSAIVGAAATTDAGVSMFTMNPMVALIERFGLIVALLLYFVWLNHKHQQEAKRREEILHKKITESNAKIDESTERHEKFLTEVINKNTEAIASIKEIVKECPNRGN